MLKHIEILLFYLLSTVESKIISTKTGDVAGSTINVLGQQIDVYLGIPYAVPPLGELRFKPPNTIEPWDGVYNATKNPPSCTQVFCSENCSEDCLYLNIWVPSNVSDAAVMVWIYGGAFIIGSINQETYNGSVMSAIGNVIVASINYRVGPFGFLCSGTDDARGNMGMKDQVLGLKWIYDNVENFGGNSSKITLFGQSSGSISVSAHMVSPLTKGLFRYAIMQSGSAYTNLLMRNTSLIKTRSTKLALMVGCTNFGQDIASDPKVMECLRNQSADSIILAETLILVDMYFRPENPWLSIYTPVYGDDYLPNSPIQEIAAGNIHIDNFIIGNVKDEGSPFLLVLTGAFVLALVDRPIINKLKAAAYIKSMFRGLDYLSSEEVIDYYLGNTSYFHSILLKRAYDSMGDFVFHCPSVFLAEDNFTHGKNVYYYDFSQRWSRSTNKEWVGVPHGDDMPFVFGMPFRNESLYTPEEKQFSEDLIVAWTSFAKEGKPSYRRLDDEWPEYEDSRMAIDLNAYNATFINPYKNACHFWKKYL